MGKVLVTGGAGYIGSHTIIELLKDNRYDVISADNFSNSTKDTFDRIERITNKWIKNYPIDLTDEALTRSIFEENKDIIGIIHFAAFKSVPESVADPLSYYHNNLNSLANLLKCAKQYHVSSFIFSSSCSVYGDVESLPVNENTPLQKAASPYGYTKQIGEQMLNDFAKICSSLNLIALRYFNPVGAHPSGLNGEVPLNRPSNLVPVITQTAVGINDCLNVYGNDYDTLDGTCIRDYVHVCDIANAHVLALDYLKDSLNANNYEVFNLGTGNGVSVLEAIHAFEKVAGKALNYKIAPRREGDVAAIYSDCSLAKKKLGWVPQYSIEDMMRTAWKWQQYIS